MSLDKKQIIAALEAIIDTPGRTEEEKQALRAACSIIKKKNKTEGYLEGLRWIRVALGFLDDIPDK
jgi:hypothetical protein